MLIEFKWIDGVEIGIYCVGDDVYVFENVCLYVYVLLMQGFVDEGMVECLLYEVVFDIKMGECLKGLGGCVLKQYVVCFVGEEIQIKVE